MNVVPLFVLLDVYGQYWFAPGWETDLDYYYQLFQPGLTTITAIETFNWPAGAGAADGIRFWSALTNASMTEVLGNVAMVSFGWKNALPMASGAGCGRSPS